MKHFVIFLLALPMSCTAQKQSSITFYDLMTRLIPDEGKAAAVNSAKTIKAVTWDAPQIDGVYNTMPGEAQIDYAGTRICEGVCSWLELRLDPSAKNYTGFVVEADIEDEGILDAWPDEGFLQKLMSEESYTARLISDADEAMQYELAMPGKRTAWVDIAVSYGFSGEDGLPRLIMTVYFDEGDLP